MTTVPESSTQLSLLASLVAGQSASQSWPVFVEKYGRLLYRWATRWGASPHDAEEIMQETLILIYQKLELYFKQPKSNFRSWLKTVAYRCWLQILEDRDVSRLKELPTRMSPDAMRLICSEEAGNDLVSEFDRIAISEILELASHRVRQRVEESSWACFQLMYVEKLSCQEIAQRLGMHLPAVYTCLSRVRQLLRAEIQAIDKTLDL